MLRDSFYLFLALSGVSGIDGSSFSVYPTFSVSLNVSLAANSSSLCPSSHVCIKPPSSLPFLFDLFVVGIQSLRIPQVIHRSVADSPTMFITGSLPTAMLGLQYSVRRGRVEWAAPHAPASTDGPKWKEVRGTATRSRPSSKSERILNTNITSFSPYTSDKYSLQCARFLKFAVGSTSHHKFPPTFCPLPSRLVAISRPDNLRTTT